MKLQPGMTVQYHSPFWRVAFCVRCYWCSRPLKYLAAKRLAASEGTHTCPGETP